MCGMKYLFEKLKEGNFGNIAFGDRSQRPVQGKSQIPFKLKNGE